jgi:hypothetical protein
VAALEPASKRWHASDGELTVHGVHLPRLLHAFLEHYTATSLFMILRLWLCGLTAYLCARGIGLGVGAARFFSIGWMLSAFNLLWSYCPVPDGAAWLPLIFLGVEWIVDGKLKKGFWVVSLGAALLLLSGHPESAFAMGGESGCISSCGWLCAGNWGQACGAVWAWPGRLGGLLCWLAPCSGCPLWSIC